MQIQLSVINKTLLDEIKQLKDKTEGKWCPETWMRFGLNCYYKSTEEKNWIDSRSFCQYVGADLVVINSKEEQEFVSKLNPNKESWIGLFAESSPQTQKSEWKWVDGSLQTEAFWDETFADLPYDYYAVSLNTEGKWTIVYQTKYRNWICEK
ncbi:C-type lectin domain family 17, member A-like [Oryzias melastigma]|uniref:C-type lectin domain family 17, member A-like n=1 Tax=Oryzias melastigma TaxID=30732 RepID=UPI00168D003F|nr:C-type lectin domain family 17, member A-like [Oryzias melastigma]